MDAAEIKTKLTLIDRYHAHEISLDHLAKSLFPHNVDDLTDEQEDAFDAMVEVEIHYARCLTMAACPLPKC